MLRITNISKFEQIRKAFVIGAALMVVLGQLALATKPVQAAPQDNGTDSAAKQQPVVQTPPPPAATQQGSDTPPANNPSTPPSNGVGLIADPVKDESKGNVGSIITDPVRAPGDSADAANKDEQSSSNDDPILIHCGPGSGCSKEDSDAPKDDKSGSTNSKEDPILIHCSPGSGCSKEDSDAPNKDDKSGSISTSFSNSSNSEENPILIHCSPGSGCSKSDAQGQSANTGSGELHGCPYNYEYDEGLGICIPTANDLGFFTVLGGDEPWPDSVGGYLSFGLDVLGDSLQIDGALLMKGADALGDTLSNWGDQVGGPLGWGLQGLSGIVSYTGDMAGAILEGAGQVANAVSDGVGDVADAVGDAAEDAWDEVSSWW
jgi:hypothetical protein